MSLSHIIDPSSLTNPITTRLKEVLGIKTLNIEATIHKSDEIIYSFTSGDNGRSIVDSEFKSKEFVIPIVKSSSSEPYWMGYSLTFKKNKGKSHYNLFHVSIRVFKGKFSDHEMSKVLRAEWMVEDENSKNAQPHWHIHSMNSNTLQETVGFEEAEAVQEFGETNTFGSSSSTISSLSNLNEFHLAMSSQWHKNGGTHFVKLSDKNSLTLWTEGCMKYIVQQLGTLSNIKA